MHVIDVAQKIERAIKILGIGRRMLKKRAKRKAEAIADYEKAIALTLIKMKESVEMNFEGYKIKGLPVSIMEKVAKGMCFNEKLEMEIAEANYKNAIVGMKAIEAELNGWQSIYRHLDET